MTPQEKLAASIESRKRAWRVLQQIRSALEVRVKIPPPPRPPNFEEEGKLLEAAIIEMQSDPDAVLRKLLTACKDMEAYRSIEKMNYTSLSAYNAATQAAEALLQRNAGIEQKPAAPYRKMDRDEKRELRQRRG